MQADCTAAAHAAACGATHARGPVHGERVPVQKASAGEGGVCSRTARGAGIRGSTGGGALLPPAREAARAAARGAGTEACTTARGVGTGGPRGGGQHGQPLLVRTARAAAAIRTGAPNVRSIRRLGRGSRCSR